MWLKLRLKEVLHIWYWLFDFLGPPANAIIHHYYGYTETVNIGNDNINYYVEKKEPKKEKGIYMCIITLFFCSCNLRCYDE